MTSSQWASLFLPLVVVSVSPGTPVSDFCSDLATALDAEPQEFSSLRGGYDRDMEGYLSRLQIQPDEEGENCWISQMDEDPWEFTCMWDAAPSVSAAESRGRAVANQVEGCLQSGGRRFMVRTAWQSSPAGTISTRSSRDLGGGRAVFLVQGSSGGHDINVRVSARCSENARRGTRCYVHLTISAEEVT